MHESVMHSPAIGAARASLGRTAAGVGFKPAHFADIVARRQPIDVFEVHAENYMGDGGVPHAQLTRLRSEYAISLHGVGLSIGGAGPLDGAHLGRLRALCRRYEPAMFSEHLAWSSHGGTFFNDLLPLPYNAATLQRVAAHVDQVQDALDRRILLENPSTYLGFAETTMPEAAFIGALCRRTGCGLLLDVANVRVSAVNQARDPHVMLDLLLGALPGGAVGEIHLAGHEAAVDAAGGDVLLDTHGSIVPDAVWSLYHAALRRLGPIPTVIEWDNDVPDWLTLKCQADLARQRMATASRPVVV